MSTIVRTLSGSFTRSGQANGNFVRPGSVPLYGVATPTPSADVRITEDGNTRITEAGDRRIVE